MSKSFPNHRGHGKYAPDDYRTPDDLFEGLDARFGPHTLDPAANEQNAKCEAFFTVEDNGLFQTWDHPKIWVNPPWHSIDPWVDKAIIAAGDGSEVTMLLPARTGTKWFGRALKAAESIHFIRGRVGFHGPHSPEGGKSIEDCCVIRFTELGLTVPGARSTRLMNNVGEEVTAGGWLAI